MAIEPAEVNLTKAQVKKLKRIFDYYKDESDAGRNGMIVGQFYRPDPPRQHYFRVGVVGCEDSIKILLNIRGENDCMRQLECLHQLRGEKKKWK